MALRSTIRQRTAATPAPTPAAELTIDQARQQYAVGSLELVIAELKEDDRLSAIAKEHANAANRQGTKVKGAVRSYALATNMQPEDELQVGENGYRYDVTHSEKVSAAGLYAMLKDGKITEDEFLRSINVNKADAEKAIGPHKLLHVTEITPGKTLDIRKRKLDIAVKEPAVIRANHKAAPKLNLSQQEAPPTKTATTKNRIILKRKPTLRATMRR